MFKVKIPMKITLTIVHRFVCHKSATLKQQQQQQKLHGGGKSTKSVTPKP
jgi:hypothetical protein